MLLFLEELQAGFLVVFGFVQGSVAGSVVRVRGWLLSRWLVLGPKSRSGILLSFFWSPGWVLPRLSTYAEVVSWESESRVQIPPALSAFLCCFLLIYYQYGRRTFVQYRLLHSLVWGRYLVLPLYAQRNCMTALTIVLDRLHDSGQE